MQEINVLEPNIGSFQILGKYLPFPHPGISFMTKDLSQIKVYTYFNIGDTKTLVKLKTKKSKFSRNCSIYPYFGKFSRFFVSLVLNFGQVTKLLTETDTIAYSLLE